MCRAAHSQLYSCHVLTRVRARATERADCRLQGMVLHCKSMCAHLAMHCVCRLLPVLCGGRGQGCGQNAERHPRHAAAGTRALWCALLAWNLFRCLATPHLLDHFQAPQPTEGFVIPSGRTRCPGCRPWVHTSLCLPSCLPLRARICETRPLPLPSKQSGRVCMGSCGPLSKVRQAQGRHACYGQAPCELWLERAWEGCLKSTTTCVSARIRIAPKQEQD